MASGARAEPPKGDGEQDVSAGRIACSQAMQVFLPCHRARRIGRSRRVRVQQVSFMDFHGCYILQLVWEEYRDANPDGYGYSRFCELYQRWRKKLDVVLRQEHKAGEKAFVDWAGGTMPIYDRDTGNVWPAALFVAALGASS